MAQGAGAARLGGQPAEAGRGWAGGEAVEMGVEGAAVLGGQPAEAEGEMEGERDGGGEGGRHRKGRRERCC